MQKVINPWTGKTKSSKSEGKFVEILQKHYPNLEVKKSGTYYKSLAQKLLSIKNNYSKQYHEYKCLFDLQSKIKKIEQINNWIEKLSQSSDSLSQKNVPIDSSYLYLPLYSGTVFHQILKECKHSQTIPLPLEGQAKQLKKQLDQIQSILNLNNQLMENIIQ